jgi:hypothetical protein
LFCEVDADLFDLVDVLASGVDSFSCPSLGVSVAKVGEYGFSDSGTRDILACDEREGVCEPFLMGF